MAEFINENGVLYPEAIYIQNDFFDEVVDNPSKYNNPIQSSVLYDVSFRHIKGYTVLDYLFLNSIENGYYQTFITNLKQNELYDPYVEFTVSNDNDFMKAYLCVFMEPENIELVYNSKFRVAQDLVNKGDDYTVNQRILGLMRLSHLELDERTVKYIKNSIKKLFYTNSYYKDNYDKSKLKETVNSYCNYIEKHAKKYNLKNE